MNAAQGYLDLQVNGYAGADFNSDDLTSESLHAACDQLRSENVAGILATVITDAPSAMARRLSRIVQLRRADPLAEELILGVHIEGPFLNEQPGYIGAHSAAAAVPADWDVMTRLLDAADGLTRIVTLAPERDAGNRVVRRLADRGVVVSAGHCDPSRDQLAGAIDAGLSMFTHLGNACPTQMNRHDNIIQRVLSLSDRLVISFIADGVHLPSYVLANYLRCVGLDHAVVVTDAISAAGLGPGTYALGNQTVVVDERLTTWSADRTHLMGSAVTMNQAVHVLQHEVGLAPSEVRQLVVENPRRLLGDQRDGDPPA
ncbi:MAG: N-acetylglucosamine-6-phosphate deacetylase [Pirellulales bacterium]